MVVEEQTLDQRYLCTRQSDRHILHAPPTVPLWAVAKD